MRLKLNVTHLVVGNGVRCCTHVCLSSATKNFEFYPFYRHLNPQSSSSSHPRLGLSSVFSALFTTLCFLPVFHFASKFNFSQVVHSTLRLVGNLCTQPNVIDLLDDNTINSLRLPVELVELVIPPSRPAARRLFGLESPRSQGPLDDATAEDQDCCHLLSVRFLFDLITLLDKQRDLLLKRGDLIITYVLLVVD